MPRVVITPAGWASPRAPYSHAVLADGILYVSGIVGQLPSGEIPRSVEEQTALVLELLSSILLEAGGTLDDVTMNSVFLKNDNDFKAMNGVYGRFFSHDPPARCTVRADMMHPKFLVEIASIAHLKQASSARDRAS